MVIKPACTTVGYADLLKLRVACSPSTLCDHQVVPDVADPAFLSSERGETITYPGAYMVMYAPGYANAFLSPIAIQHLFCDRYVIPQEALDRPAVECRVTC